MNPPETITIHGYSEIRDCSKDEPLTKRERFAMAAMQGLISMCKNPKVTTRELVEDSVAIADALTSALKSIPEPE